MSKNLSGMNEWEIKKVKSKIKARVLPSSTWRCYLMSLSQRGRLINSCIKMKNARAGRAQFADVTVVLIKYADLWGMSSLPLSLCKFHNRIMLEHLRQQRFKSRIWLVESGKISVLLVRHLLKKNSVPSNNMLS